MRQLLRYRDHDREPLWHAQSAILIAIILQLSLPDRYVLGSHYVLVGCEAILLVLLSFTTPKERIFRSLARRFNVLLLIALAGVANGYGLAAVADKLLQFGTIANGRTLILAAINIYLTNIIVFAMFYREMDGGGPGLRQETEDLDRDFMFPQTQANSAAPSKWLPTFIDYVYVSATNAMAFSPTDTLPLSRRAKLLMLSQACISLIAVALVAARAVNILH